MIEYLIFLNTGRRRKWGRIGCQEGAQRRKGGGGGRCCQDGLPCGPRRQGQGGSQEGVKEFRKRIFWHLTLCKLFFLAFVLCVSVKKIGARFFVFVRNKERNARLSKKEKRITFSVAASCISGNTGQELVGFSHTFLDQDFKGCFSV